MRSLRLREGAREGRQSLAEAIGLLRQWPLAALALGLVLAFLPAMVRAFLVVRANRELLALWEGYIGADASSAVSQSLLDMIPLTLSRFGQAGLASTLLDLAKSLIFSPVLLASLALLFNGYIHAPNRAALVAVKEAGRQFSKLIFVALVCMLAEWIVQMVPSIASGLLNLLTEMLSWIPVLGTIVGVLAVILSILISLLTDFAVIVIFCYVWICAACEGVPGFGALVRSWQLTRNNMHRTIAALLSLTLLRWLAVVIAGAIWLLLSRTLHLPLAGFLYVAYGIGAAYTVFLGAVTSALYQRRPLPSGPKPGQFRPGGPDLDTLKRANLD